MCLHNIAAKYIDTGVTDAITKHDAYVASKKFTPSNITKWVSTVDHAWAGWRNTVTDPQHMAAELVREILSSDNEDRKTWAFSFTTQQGDKPYTVAGQCRRLRRLSRPGHAVFRCTEHCSSAAPMRNASRDTGTRRWALVAQHWCRVLYPHSPFGLVARVSATHKRDQTVAGPPQSPTRSFEGSGSQTAPQPPCPLVQWAGRDHPLPIFAGSPWRERDLARRVRHERAREYIRKSGHSTSEPFVRERERAREMFYRQRL
jgi:hypothetical protein